MFFCNHNNPRGPPNLSARKHERLPMTDRSTRTKLVFECFLRHRDAPGGDRRPAMEQRDLFHHVFFTLEKNDTRQNSISSTETRIPTKLNEMRSVFMQMKFTPVYPKVHGGCFSMAVNSKFTFPHPTASPERATR